ncbi:hypothetical protein [Nocardia sp. bgisy134]|uniref:hypothetical protein n=1 Tax=Nocardia sp. bgisy134 TaxID=3413789 RepID=UPI003D715367
MIFSAILPAQAAGAADATVLAGVYSPGFYSGDTITDVELVAPPGYSAITGVATNNVTVSVRHIRNGTVLQTFAAVTTTEGTNLVPESPISIPITAQPVLLMGDVIDVRMRQNGAGHAVGTGLTVYVFIS